MGQLSSNLLQLASVQKTTQTNQNAVAEAVPIALVVGCCLVFVSACLQILMFPFGRDQGVYAVIGDRILAGGLPYRDGWDIHPPGIYYIYALAEKLFGHRMISLRIVEVSVLLSLYVPFSTVGRSLYKSRKAGIIAWALAALSYASSEYWYTGQSESLGAMLTVWAVAFAVDAAPRLGRYGAWIAMGLLFGLCFLLKPQLALSALPCAVYAGWLEARRAGQVYHMCIPMFVGAVASAIPISGCLAWLWLKGAGTVMYETYLLYAPAYTALKWQPLFPIFGPLTIWAVTPILFVLRLPALVLIGLTSAVIFKHNGFRNRPAAILIGTAIILQLIAVAVAGKLFEYHYFAALFLSVISAADGLAKLWERYVNGTFIGALMFCIITGILGFIVPAVRQTPSAKAGATQFWKRSMVRTAWLLGTEPQLTTRELNGNLYNLYATNLDDYEEAAAIIDAMTQPKDPIFIWGCESVIYWLANRPPASRYIHDFPLRADWYRDQSRATLMLELERSQPAVIVVEKGDFAPDIVGNYLDSTEALQGFPQLREYLNDHFKFRAKVGKITIFRRTDGSGRASKPQAKTSIDFGVERVGRSLGLCLDA